jgi:hypothetical protein
MNIVLARDTFTPFETLGLMTVGSQRFHTIERPWVAGNDPGEDGGEPGKSCVPAGTYDLVLHDTPNHPHSFALVNRALDVVHLPTPGYRSSVLIHSANWVIQLEGCIALGLGRVEDKARLDAHWMITSSKAAMAQFSRLVPWELGHTLTIQRAPLPEPKP